MPVLNNSFFFVSTGDSTDKLQEIVDNKTSFRGFLSYYQGTTIPLFDTSKIKSMTEMFQYSPNLTTVPLYDTSNVTSMGSLFYNCSSLTTVPLFDTSNVTNMSNMFQGCGSLTTVPLFDTSKVTNMYYMFSDCSSLTTIPQLNVSKVSTMGYMFRNCSNLKSILMFGMKADFDISASTQFEREDLVTILNNLASASRTLTMGSTNLAKLTDEDKAIATGKGWTLV